MWVSSSTSWIVQQNGTVTSYAIDSKGLLTTVDQQVSNGGDPAHLIAIPSGEIIEPNVRSNPSLSESLATHYHILFLV